MEVCMPRLLTILIAVIVLGGCSHDIRNTGGAAETPGRFSVGEFILYRLDGNYAQDIYGVGGDRHPDDAELLHGFGVLAKCSIESVDDRNRLFTALEEGQAFALSRVAIELGQLSQLVLPPHAEGFLDVGTAA